MKIVYTTMFSCVIPIFYSTLFLFYTIYFSLYTLHYSIFLYTHFTIFLSVLHYYNSTKYFISLLYSTYTTILCYNSNTLFFLVYYTILQNILFLYYTVLMSLCMFHSMFHSIFQILSQNK